jgi:hypothetical protein
VRSVYALVLVAACGSRTTPSAGAPPDAEPRVLAPRGDACPETYAAATGPCDPASATSSCQYDDGQCTCGQAPVCRGAIPPPPDPDEPPPPTSWQCSAWPPAVRDDGCPGVAPQGACRGDGKRCSYGACCVATYVCARGAWAYDGSECPP